MIGRRSAFDRLQVIPHAHDSCTKCPRGPAASAREQRGDTAPTPDPRNPSNGRYSIQWLRDGKHRFGERL